MITSTLDVNDPAVERNLGEYVAAVGDAVGAGPAASAVDLGPPVSVYLAVDQRIAGRDAALLWSERHGWSVATESHPALTVLGYLGPDLLPPPNAVARFLADAVRGLPLRIEPPHPRSTDLDRRLVAYLPAGLRDLCPLPRSAERPVAATGGGR
uniref:Noc2 n=1 Tax=Nocardia sp. ATCC 202099 TaxID=930400 RepID=E5DUI8_9NOCA|nr:Noc2 [Nocardia sp. ATCC 202099]